MMVMVVVVTSSRDGTYIPSSRGLVGLRLKLSLPLVGKLPLALLYRKNSNRRNMC